jgi:hypothetical protein
MSNGQCACSTGYKGADCSLKNTNLTDYGSGSFSRQTQNGPKYYSFSVEGGVSSNVSFSTDAWPMDVYIKKGSNSNPTEFEFDIAIKQKSALLLNSAQLGLLDGYSVYIYVQAYDERTNTFFVNHLNTYFVDETTPPF